MANYIWEAYGKYADGTTVTRYFEPNKAIDESTDIFNIEEWLIQNKPNCIFYSVDIKEIYE